MRESFNRLKDWRALREHLATLDENDQIEALRTYWEKMPMSLHVLDYDNAKEWPTPWELISENYYDTNVIAYLMMETLKNIGWSEDRFELAYIQDKNDNSRLMVLILDNKNVLNYSYGEIVSLDNVRENIYTLIRYKIENNSIKEI